MMTPLLLVLAVFIHINGISCDGELTIKSEQKQFCDYDAFISSKPTTSNKVFLVPYKFADKTGGWYENSGYCAEHCAEMVKIDSAAENQQLVDFLRSTGMANNGVWLGANIDNMQTITHWYDGSNITYTHPKYGTEYNEPGLTGLLTGFEATNGWGSWFLTQRTVFIACQRAVGWKICE